MLLKEMFDLKGKNIIITGGSGWLGRSMSEALAEYGANLILLSRNENKNRELSDYLTNTYGNKNFYYKMDLSDKKEIENGYKKIIKEHKRIDVLINNSYYGAGKELHNMKNNEWEKGIDGSVNAVFRLSKLVIKNMMEYNKGKIINIASMYGIVAPDVRIYDNNDFYNPANYGAGKAAIIQLTKYIAAVYGKYNITCNSISPGPFPSPQVQKNIEFIKSLEEKVPLKRIGNPEDLKGIILLLASEASNYINGENISVDGGWTKW